MKKAFITGITGQDGSYLAELLLEKGYEVYGLYRRSSTDSHFERIEHLKGKINLVCGDLTDLSSLDKLFEKIRPDEIYNLASQSQVGLSFSQPFFTNEVNWLGTERIIECMKKYVPKAKLYQASTSELFGATLESPQSEKTPFNPVSPYAESKLKAHNAIKRERDNGLFACAGILFNHESPRRGIEFVTRKFSEGIARIKLGLPQRETGKSYLELGNINAKRDWGYSKDYVEAMWLILQQEKPEDFVIATGRNHSVREFIEAAAKVIDIKITWKGDGIYEEGFDQEGNKIIAINEKFFRPKEVNVLLGDFSKAREKLGWAPKTNFEDLVKLMVEEDLKKLKSKAN
jgi:GDPmannose 4,6-dehydratase